MLNLSIVVPVYRSQMILEALVLAIQNSLDNSRYLGRYELLLVNDGSPDESWSVIAALASRFPFVKGIDLRRNFGQHNATMAGLTLSGGDMVVIMDDDLQHPPDSICDLTAALEAGADVCYTRYVGRKHSIFKIFGSKFNDLVATVLLDKPKSLYLSSFKALKKEVVAEVIKYDGPYAYLDGLILGVTRSIAVVDIHHQERHDGEGNYNLRRSISLWLKMATSFSIIPLRLATVLGFSLAVLSVIVIGLIGIQKLRHPDWPAGWASVMATVLFIGGVQTFCLGMMGEYLGRAYLKINKKPQFSVRQLTWKAPP